MWTYIYDCPTHGRREVVKARDDAGRAEHCPACAVLMRRIYTPPRVQNSTATENSLKSWGDPWRYDPIPKAEWVAQERAARREEEG